VPTTAKAFVDYLAETGQSGIADTASIFGGEVGLFLGPLLLTGATLYLGVPFLLRGLVAGLQGDNSEWLVVSVYAAWFLLLSVVQLRFAGQLGLLIVPFAGVGFVWLASLVDVAERPTVFEHTDGGVSFVPSAPSRQTLVSLSVLFLVVGGVGAVQTSVKSGQVATDEATYQVATELADVAGETTGDEYVLSRWGENRVYNYFLTGDSRSYSFARREFGSFVAATNRTAAWQQAGSRAEYVVVGEAGTRPETIHSRLYDEYGSGTAETRGLEHYRFVAAADEGTRRAFETVAGATVPVHGHPNTTLEVTVPVNVDGAEFTYSRRVTTDRYGEATVDVPYTGKYRTGEEQTVVTDEAVEQGALVGSYRLHLPLDEGSGRVVTATVGDGRGELDGERWTRGVVGSGLAFDGDSGGSLRLRETNVRFGERSGTVCAWANQSESDRRLQDVVNVGGGELVLTWNGAADVWLVYVAGSDTVGRAKAVVGDHDGWSHLCARVDRGTVGLWIDGNRRATGNLSGSIAAGSEPFFVGGAGEQRQFDGRIDDVRVYSRGLSPAEIERLAAAGENRTTQRDRSIDGSVSVDISHSAQ
jgi:dolichyl-diphosphooligosaccharide--protein glycosyltransferase